MENDGNIGGEEYFLGLRKEYLVGVIILIIGVVIFMSGGSENNINASGNTNVSVDNSKKIKTDIDNRSISGDNLEINNVSTNGDFKIDMSK